MTSPYANYSYNWNTELEDNGEYYIKTIVNDHNTYMVSGNVGATEDIIVNVHNQSIDDGNDDDGGDSDGEDTNGYMAVKNVSHHKSMGGVYGSLTKLRKIEYANGEDLSEYITTYSSVLDYSELNMGGVNFSAGINYTLSELPVNIFGFLDPFKKH